MYLELITILVRAKDDITRACRRCQSTLYIVFNIAKVGGPHKSGENPPYERAINRNKHFFRSFSRGISNLVTPSLTVAE